MIKKIYAGTKDGPLFFMVTPDTLEDTLLRYREV